MKRFIPLLVVVPVLFLLACNLTRLLTGKPEQPVAEIASPTPVPLPATEAPTTQPPIPIVYYYFVNIEEESPPEGSVVVLPDELILAPTPSSLARGSDTATNIRSALQAMIDDPRNVWMSTDVNITSVTFNEGAMEVVLEGEYFGVGDVVLIAARMQMLLTVFAEASVQTAAITLNGESIANLGSSGPGEPTPADHQFTRLEIETFMADYAYTKP